MNKPIGTCKFDGCENEIKHSELGICYTCYSGLRYWRDRSISHKRARLQQIIRLNSRMEYMVTGEPMPKKKRRATKNGKSQKG